MSIHERLRTVRNHLALSQSDAALKFGIPVSTYRKYETGPSEPGAGALRELANNGVNINWLLTGEGEMLASNAGLSDYATFRLRRIDTDLLAEIALEFEIAFKAWIEEDQAALWVLGRDLFPDAVSDDERPTDDEIEALSKACFQRIRFTHLISSVYNDAIKEPDVKRRKEEISSSAIAAIMFLKDPKKLESLRGQIEQLKKHFLVSKGERLEDQEIIDRMMSKPQA